MDLGFGRERFSNEEDEEEDKTGIGKLVPFSCYSSSSSSSHLIPLRWDQPRQKQMGAGWGEDNNGTTATPSTTTRANDDEESFRHRNSYLSAPDTSALSSRIDKEYMFDKVVTPSDVGKLNRLVIPKQHAERYFPLDSSTNVKGLLLNFEDPDGKPWRFRYSYWNSSQSYVMTKGWSRFVKDKKLNAGDIVSFQRGAGEEFKERFFIDWRRRHDAPIEMSFQHQHFNFNRSIPWSPMLMQPAAPQLLHRSNYYSNYDNLVSDARNNYGSYGNAVSGNVVNHVNPVGRVIGPVYYMGSGMATVGIPQMGMEWQQQGGGGVEPVVFDSVPVVQGNAAAKRLRLFGVNMDCPIMESDEEDCEIIAAPPPVVAPPPHFTSSSHNLPLQLRFYNSKAPFPHPSSKGKSSSSSLDFVI